MKSSQPRQFSLQALPLTPIQDSALWPAPAPMPLAPLHFPILQQVIPAVLLRSQPLFFYQLPYPHRRNAQDLSGLFRSDQAHLTKSCTPRREINQPYSDLGAQTTEATGHALLLLEWNLPPPDSPVRFRFQPPALPISAFAIGKQ